MTATRGRPIPWPDADRLKRLHTAEDWPGLALACAQLEMRGYTLAAMGRTLNVSREMIRRRVARVPVAELAGIVPDPQPVRPPYNPYTKVQQVPPADLDRMRALRPVAASRRAGQAADHPAQQATVELNSLLARLYAPAGGNVALARLAEALGVTPAAVRFRIKEHKEHLTAEGESGSAAT